MLLRSCPNRRDPRTEQELPCDRSRPAGEGSSLAGFCKLGWFNLVRGGLVGWEEVSACPRLPRAWECECATHMSNNRPAHMCTQATAQLAHTHLAAFGKVYPCTARGLLGVSAIDVLGGHCVGAGHQRLGFFETPSYNPRKLLASRHKNFCNHNTTHASSGPLARQAASAATCPSRPPQLRHGLKGHVACRVSGWHPATHTQRS